MKERTSITISWLFIILLGTLSGVHIQPHINEIDSPTTIIIDDMWLTTRSPAPVDEYVVVKEWQREDYHVGGGGILAPNDLNYSDLHNFYMNGR